MNTYSCPRCGDDDKEGNVAFAGSREVVSNGYPSRNYMETTCHCEDCGMVWNEWEKIGGSNDEG